MTSGRLIKLGQITTLISFILGSTIFGLYYFTSAAVLLLVGSGFITLTGLINIAVLISILIKAQKDKTNRKQLLNTSGLILLNIPIMIAYCWVVIILLGTMRVTFTNKTNTEITDINIIGCSSRHIENLEVGKSKTVWIEITGDCSIYINYQSNGQQKEETVVDYVTYSMGHKVNHNIIR